jgi:3-dehydroquinate dehydratase/shikimate dehydrogenase
VTYLCVPIFARTPPQLRRDIAAALEAGAEMIELRLDALENPADLDPVLSAAKSLAIPWIATCRLAAEGGHYPGDESSRRLILSAVAAVAPYVDVELSARDELPAGPAKCILSSHDLHGRPERLHSLLLEMAASSHDVLKIVWTARSIRDNLEAFEILQRKVKPAIALCMGEAGLLSRVLAKKFGAFLTFASLDEPSATAPGQVSIRRMKNLYRWDAMTRSTKVFGVIAHPVNHSLSPAVHNAAFTATGFDGVYLPLLVQPGYESFKAFMESFVPFDGLDLCGLSITLPHKENALRYLREKGGQVEDLASRIGAVNTIAISRPDLSLRGINTDYLAILDTITSALGCARADLAGLPVAVLGAGGTGRTAVAALTHCGAKVTIFNRTPGRANALAAEFGAVAQPLNALPAVDCRVYVNTTSVGMHPNVDAGPFDGHAPKLDARTLVFDTIYNPIKTKLLKQAEAAGAVTVSGVEMFVQQAAAQFELWTGNPAPSDIMRQAMRRILNPEN